MTTLAHPVAEIVRRLADDIAANGPTRGSTRSLPDQIAHVRTVSDAAQRQLQEALRPLHPDVGWTSEEGRPSADAYWLYDAIDGAYHYLQGLPLWASSLVLVRHGVPVMGCVYDATRRQLFFAEAGAGTTCDGRPVRVSEKESLSTAVVGTAIPPLVQVGADEQDQALRLAGAIARQVFVVRPMAAVSLQLAYTAAGRLDGYWENGRDTADWLAGALLVREAGGVVTDLRGDPFGWESDGVLAGGAAMQAGLLDLTRLQLGNAI